MSSRFDRKKPLLLLCIVLCFVLAPRFTLAVVVDFAFDSQELSQLAFGSCHKSKRNDGHVFDNIPKSAPVWIWTGDAIYPPKRGIASVELLRQEYQNLKTNHTLGYAEFVQNKTILATWDDHDYGGNDAGETMPDRQERAAALWEFIGLEPPANNRRAGMYSSATFGTVPNQVKVILLDTRWHREEYCIPSVAMKVPIMGAGIACLTRWLSAGLLDKTCPNDRSMLGPEQWKWLETELANSQASVNVIVSSVQVLTTNPAMESWGHFPKERDRLIRLLHNVSGAVILSGDVHHGEILDPRANSMIDSSNQDDHSRRQSSFLEVTSSGLTHICSKQGMYGFMCEPLLTLFHRHRYQSIKNYYLEPSFGTIQIDWEARAFRVNVHSVKTGEVVLTTGDRFFDPVQWADNDFERVLPCMNGHLKPLLWSVLVATGVLWMLLNRQRKGI
jgi:alkaline phosphatase D